MVALFSEPPFYLLRQVVKIVAFFSTFGHFCTQKLFCHVLITFEKTGSFSFLSLPSEKIEKETHEAAVVNVISGTMNDGNQSMCVVNKT